MGWENATVVSGAAEGALEEACAAAGDPVWVFFTGEPNADGESW